MTVQYQQWYLCWRAVLLSQSLKMKVSGCFWLDSVMECMSASNTYHWKCFVAGSGSGAAWNFHKTTLTFAHIAAPNTSHPSPYHQWASISSSHVNCNHISHLQSDTVALQLHPSTVNIFHNTIYIGISKGQPYYIKIFNFIQPIVIYVFGVVKQVD